jgi:hypothetical protein
LKQLIELLHFTPNIHTFIFTSMTFDKIDYMSIQQNETFRLVSIKNTIRNLIFQQQCTLETIKIPVTLFLRVQHLTLNTLGIDMQPVIRFLLE